MRTAIGVFTLLHGLAHLPGFLLPWRLMFPQDIPEYPMSIMDGAVPLGTMGTRVVGVLWLLAGLGCIASGILTLRGRPGWRSFAIAAVSASLALSLVGWPESAYGVASNGALLVMLVVVGLQPFTR